MNLQPKIDTVAGQKEFLVTTQGLVHKVGGVTLDASKFTPDENGFIKAGSALALTASGKAEPFSVSTPGDPSTANGTPYILAHDVQIKDGTTNIDAVAGVLEAAYLKSSVVTTAEPGRVVVTKDFIKASNGRFHLR